MDDRTKTFFSYSVLAVALCTTSCGLNQQSRFQISFLPQVPPAAVIEPAPAPVPIVLASASQPQQLPTFINANPPAPKRPDPMLQAADRRLEAGKKLYQAQDFPDARREFDAAIDLLFTAADRNPADRQEYQRRIDEMADVIHRFDLAGLGASAKVEEGKFEKAPLEDILEMTFPVDPKLKDRVREQVAATVSQLPLSVNDAVLGYINYFSNRGRRTLVGAYERSGRYRPMIQRVLDEEGLPQELIHLAQAESGFIPRAVSSKAAGGMWQFLKWRGQQYGLMQTKDTDERMDPEMATRAAAHHLHDLYNEFGDWYLAIAAYNCGPGNVEKAVERSGYADFWELRSHGLLPAETTNYVPIILAMTIMEKNAAEYGLDGLTLDPPLEYDTVSVSVPTSMTLISDITGAPPAELAALNPSVLKGMVPDNYPLHVPKGTGNDIMAALQLIPAEHRASWRMHRVGAGETLTTIGKLYGTTQASIIAANRLPSAEAVEGDRLLIPAVLRVAPPARHATTRATVARAGVHKKKPSHKVKAKGSVILARVSTR